jgi:ferredoxin
MRGVTRIIIEESLCQANGQCALAAPEIFEVRDDLAVVRAGGTPQEHRQAVETAVRRCPTGAIRVEWAVEEAVP